MAGVLSQDEVDALLKNFVGGEGETEAEPEVVKEEVKPRDPSEVDTYDITSQDKIVGYSMPTLDIIFERFSRNYRTTLSTILRKTVEMNLVSTNTVKFGDLMKALPIPTSLHIFRMEPLEGSGLLIIQSELVFALIDILFGGKGTKIKLEGREYTTIEMRVINRFRDALLKDLETSWESVMEVSCHHVRSEVNPQFVWIVPPEEPVHKMIFEMEVEQSTGDLTIALPYSMLQPIKGKLMAVFVGNEDETKGWAQRIQPLLMDSKVNVVAEFGKTTITCGDLINLKKGDIIPLDKFVEDPVMLLIEGVEKFTGHSGQHRGSTSVQIASLFQRR
jgi:flagellar motor switch protein FliM